ncbi:LOW QUALITY PROTEIN: protein stoned-B-like [Cylas formicarius]|uniref:LOW QUALITY PROTEIN: protein stoned-B-like n=1 Tax=Cylas formicarius TaxID=197179 RepID=UPI002958D97A|nr:LOW QUALITY PROTEIN: protein stoned-B-like [Cylas formicarius]
MHKLAKGLKKKKKDKKSKRAKDEELFKPEELEEYRRQHCGTSEPPAENEEWKKFISLTSGVDHVLKKTQDDLDRIKSTSFFQRSPAPSKPEEKPIAHEQRAERLAQEKEEPEPELGIVPVSESESEEEEEDDVFDTAYIDVIASGEVQLAYIPESPTEKEGDDPFDTSIAERAILGPAVDKKGKKLVPLGAAVEVLTGRVQLPTCATKVAAGKRRQPLKEPNLLLGSFDSGPDYSHAAKLVESSEKVKTLLDDDDVPKIDTPIDLTTSLYVAPIPASDLPQQAKLHYEGDDDDDKEFEVLAAQSLSKTSKVVVASIPTVSDVDVPPASADWQPFADTLADKEIPVQDDNEPDPFDTTFAENILPGKAELKVIEKEILDNDIDFDPRASPVFSDTVNLRKEPVSSEFSSDTLKVEDRDLLGGSVTDLSALSVTVLQPAEDPEEIIYRDPFDTSIVDSVKQPGKAELRYLEKELLGDLDDEFDPRAGEQINTKERTLSRPDILNVSSGKSVSFAVSSTRSDCPELDESSKIAKPLTPFYVRKNSVPGLREDLSEQDFDESYDTSLAKSTPLDLLESEDIPVKVLTPAAGASGATSLPKLGHDPFDTSTANILPGKAELRVLEDELINRHHISTSDDDLLVHNGDSIIAKPLSPQIEDEIDPFDTSFASNIYPGKAELKAIESELIYAMAANPFLFAEDCLSGPATQPQATLNPFLMDEEVSFVDENPFLPQPATAATNPFAFDPMELEPAEAEVPGDHPAFMETSSANDFFVTKPTELHLEYSHHELPARPPPPRPPQSKETQDLLMSVMGEMDATSSQLLNKIPPTRSPSPVSMRDLQSPSPTPDTQFGDLLVVGDVNPKLSSTEDLLNLSSSCDINQNPSVNQAPPRPVPPPARPAPPVRPPRPAPPQKPPPPLTAPKIAAVPQENTGHELPTQNDIADLFGAPPQPKIASKADILNLYNVPKQEKVQDLLCDAVIEVQNTPIVLEAAGSASVPESLPTENPIPEQPSESPVNSNFVTDIAPSVMRATLSPEPPNELNMDTGSSQSKESVSSVTFNPFAVEADPKDTFRESLETAFQKEHKMEVSISPTAAPAPTPVPTAAQNEFDFGVGDAKRDDDVDDFDAFAQKFESVKSDDSDKKAGAFDAFASSNNNVWGGNDLGGFTEGAGGFDNDEPFDAFLAMEAPTAPAKRHESQDSDEEKDFSVVIRPKAEQEFAGAMPVIAPPPVSVQAAFTDTSPRFNPFDQQNDVKFSFAPQEAVVVDAQMKRSESQESPSTPLFDEDVSQPLEDFPRINYAGEGWEMQLRQPNKKKITGQRFWKKIFVKLVYQQDCVLLQLFNQQADKDPFQELPLQPCYSVSEIGAQQYDQFGKIFTVKLQYIFYKERPGVRPGQVKKAERITNKLSQFAAYAIQGDYQGVKEFGSDLKKLGLPVEHAPQVSQLMKLGSLSYEDLKQFSFSVEEALFHLQAHRDRALHYKMEEVQVTAVDELYVEQSAEGHVDKQIARVRLFFLGFLTGMPDIELGINDMRRQGKEVVGRHDIIPVVTEEWIRLENVEFHSCVQQDDYEKTHIIKFKPPDACYIELLRFRVRPPKNRELPLQLKAQICVTGTRIELRADVLVPGFASRKLGQIPCEDVMIRFPIPECWIYMFRVEKHFRYGSVKSAHRRTGKIKGIERILGTMETLQENLIEVTSGQAKYEHQHRAIVWRCPRLPKEGQGAYTTHNMVCRIALTSYDQMPEKLAEYCYVEFTMPATQVSHTTCRSVSLQNSDSDEPPEKYVRYLARHEYRVGIEHTEGEAPNAYATATFVKPAAAPVVEEKPAPVAEESSSDSD